MNKRQLRMLSVLLFAAFFTAFGSPAGAALPSGDELREHPAPAFVTGAGVNVRTGPSTASRSLGKLDGQASEELVATDAATGEDGKIWYLVLSGKVGEGWIRGDFLRFEGLDDPLWRLAARIRRDLGVSPDMTENRLGKPENRQSRTFLPEDRKEKVTETVLTYPDGNVVFWIPKNGSFLVSADFTGRIGGFGNITFGAGVDAVEKLLGPPHGVRNRVWTYHSGMSRIHIRFGMDGRVDRLILERDTY
ncbi:hypothetical protein SDC9_46349 [bioreactor metagenome]|uniref:SH3b domain-containing protein n=1 Tax=bioreactor metagenome TaxID=1076179 RepID=A0A644W8K2_9ZZZZ